MKNLLKLLPIVLFTAFATFSCDEAIKEHTQKEMKKTANDIAEEQKKAFKIAFDNKNWSDAYGQASLIAAMYLEANNEKEYKAWKELEKQLEAKMLEEMGM